MNSGHFLWRERKSTMAHKNRQADADDGDQHASVGSLSDDPSCKHYGDEMEAIRHAAFILWEEAGRPEGRCLEFWLEAEKDMALAHH
jgi:hypothetical protein